MGMLKHTHLLYLMHFFNFKLNDNEESLVLLFILDYIGMYVDSILLRFSRL